MTINSLHHHEQCRLIVGPYELVPYKHKKHPGCWAWYGGIPASYEDVHAFAERHNYSIEFKDKDIYYKEVSHKEKD